MSTVSGEGNLGAVRQHWVAAAVLVVVALVAMAVIGGANALSVRAEPLAQPPTPHTLEGRSDCLLCHAPGGAKPVSASHAGRDNATCLACHPAAGSAAPAAPTAAAAPAAAGAAVEAPAAPPAPAVSTNPCLSCHANQGLTMKLGKDESLSLYVDPEVLDQSAHGNQLTCMACHRDITSYPHPERSVSSRREYSLANYEACKTCHFDNYTKTLDGMHYRVLSSGDQRAPVCTDCHGSHDVQPLHNRGPVISATCAQCHGPIYDQYAASVHGKALTEGNQDVPDCTDCHGAHDMQDPRTRAFHVETPDLCAKCHTDQKVMDKYGISTNVLKTYLQDFHGVTVSFYEKRTPNSTTSVKAVCTDCHGIHDIKAADDPESTVIRANLVTTCQKCHPGATDNFPAAWLSHYEPSPTKSPIVFYVKQFYRIFIPLTVGGLAIHIGLDFWRLMLNRLRGRRS